MRARRIGARTGRGRPRTLIVLVAALGLGSCVTERVEPASPRPEGSPASEPAAIQPSNRPERVVLVTVHGLTPDAYLSSPPSMPTLASLARAGIAVEALRPVFPAAVYPAHVSLLTGRVPRHHGVPADRPVARTGVSDARYDQAADIRGITLWQAVRQAGGSVASLDWPATGGAEIVDLLPDLGPFRDGEAWPQRMVGTTTQRVADAALRAGAGKQASWQPGPERDAVLVTVACGLLRTRTPPTLLLLRLSQTEPLLAHGDPSIARGSFGQVDREIGRLVDCLRATGMTSTTAFVVAGDFGTAPVHTVVRPNELLADVGLVVVAQGGVILRWDALVRSNGGSAFVYARDEDSAILARRALLDLAESSGGFRVLSADEMLKRGGDPDAWFGLEAEPGYYFADSASGPRLGAAATARVGGYAADRPAMITGLVAWGAGLRGPLRVPEMRQTDVAPTLARLMGLSLGDAEGRTLVGLLTRGGIDLGVRPPPEISTGSSAGKPAMQRGTDRDS